MQINMINTQYHSVERILFILLLNYHYFQLSIHSIEAFIVGIVYCLNPKKNELAEHIRMCYRDTRNEV